MPALPETVIQQTISYQNIRVGAGSPNAIKQYGEPGWIYQDWTGGALYVCTVAGTAGWVLSSSGGQPSNPLLDAVGAYSVDFYNRVLIDANSNSSVDWNTRSLIDMAEGEVTIDWDNRYLFKQWQTVEGGKVFGNVMSNAPYYLSTNTGGTSNLSAPSNAGMVILHQATSAALIASMNLQFHGATSFLDSVPVGGDISFTSRYGVTALTVTYGAYTLLGTAVTTCAAGATITWRKLSSTLIARLT